MNWPATEQRADRPRIVIVGGGAAGMSCAARARRLAEPAEIVVLDRGEHVSFASCGLPYYVSGEIADEHDLLVQTPASLKDSLNLDVRTRHDVVGLDPAAKTLTVHTEAGVEIMPYDALVLAPGTVPIRPPDLESPRVRALRTVGDAAALRRTTAHARYAVVVGGGFIGLEAAEALAARGLEVTVVELAPHVLPPLEPELAHLVASELRRLGATVREGVGVSALRAGSSRDRVTLDDGTEVDADLVLLSIGVRPDTAVFERAGVACDRGAIVTDEHGRTSVPDVWAVGDATVSPDAVTGIRRPATLAGPANRAGRLVADAILRPDRARPIPSAVGTAIVRIGHLTAAITGANKATLTAQGINHHTIHLHPNQHASYFPGASPIHLVVHLRAGDGLLLGAQAVGTEGVDKRIDVLATAIRSRMVAADLIDLDLSYSPPYGSARDPVNLAGMLGENVRDGTLALWHAGDLDEVLATALVVDTRTPDEFATGHLRGALNVPHTQLRARLDEVRQAAAGRPVRVMCWSGVRSYFAHRILAQAGFDSASLSGGILTLLAALGPSAGGAWHGTTAAPKPVPRTDPATIGSNRQS